LKGLLRPWEDVLPKRFEDVWPSLRSDLSIDRDSLPTLRKYVVSQAQEGRDSGADTLYDGTKGYLCPCPLRRLLAVERMRDGEELWTEEKASWAGWTRTEGRSGRGSQVDKDKVEKIVTSWRCRGWYMAGCGRVNFMA
jgi:hypothetical protein